MIVSPPCTLFDLCSLQLKSPKRLTVEKSASRTCYRGRKIRYLTHNNMRSSCSALVLCQAEVAKQNKAVLIFRFYEPPTIVAVARGRSLLIIPTDSHASSAGFPSSFSGARPRPLILTLSLSVPLPPPNNVLPLNTASHRIPSAYMAGVSQLLLARSALRCCASRSQHTLRHRADVPCPSEVPLLTIISCFHNVISKIIWTISVSEFVRSLIGQYLFFLSPFISKHSNSNVRSLYALP